jgi:small subunit ribosomal protein S17
MKKTKKIGIDVEIPKKQCEDSHCPFHSQLRLRGRIFQGTVVTNSFHKTVKVEWPRQHYIKKYERFEKRRSRVKAHNPPCIDAKKGDKVKIMECKPISKTKNFVIIKK